MARRRARAAEDLGELDPAEAAYRPGDVYRFSMTADEVRGAAAGVVPLRIVRACFIAAPLVCDGDHAEHWRRMRAERDGTLAALMAAAGAEGVQHGATLAGTQCGAGNRSRRHGGRSRAIRGTGR